MTSMPCPAVPGAVDRWAQVLRAAALTAVALACGAVQPATTLGWDSQAWNPTHATHSYMTEWAVQQLTATYPEVRQFQRPLIDGANTELHELPSRGYEQDMSARYGLDLEAMRVRYRGTNEGCGDVNGWWQESLSAYRQGQKAQAYFLLGVVLHMVQDMGVPAHAHRILHQGNAREFDNFEFLGVQNWKPSFADINRQDPQHPEPWRYYLVSEDWTRADAPDYRSRDQFSKFWVTASSREKQLLSNRQGRTCHVTMWTVRSAVKAYGL